MIKKNVSIVMCIIVFLCISWDSQRNVGMASAPPPPTRPEGAPYRATYLVPDNLLPNNDMDQLPFYWRPTNHYVAGLWFEWWGNYNTIPEYIDGGINHHNACYPMPANGICHNKETQEYNSSQGYIRWGAPYIAGIYQPIHDVTPCTLYEFEIYNRNDAGEYHPKIGIDPSGWVITRMGASPPGNCPPDGQSRCPDPYIANFPETTIWSSELTQPAYTWGLGSITTEAISTTISVWTYAAPEHSGPLSTYWDAGSLVQVPFTNGRLPPQEVWTPSTFITNVISKTASNSLTIEWDTAAPASTQVWYEVYPASSPISNSIILSYTTYLPLLSWNKHPTSYAMSTPLDTTPKTHHTVTLPNLNSQDTVVFVLLSRSVQGNICTTKASSVFTVRDNTISK